MEKINISPELQAEQRQILELQEKFIQLANQLKDEGHPIKLINTALMLASGTYATYLTAGNEGYLKQSGIDKITYAYKHNLTLLQKMRKAQFNPDGQD